MFTSKFLPVKVQSANETAVYSYKTVYPANLLDQARAFALGEDGDCNNVVVKEGCYTFKSNPEYLWTLSDIVQACESLRVARENKFSFFIIYNNQKIPNMYVSTRFDTCRILVDAFTMRSIVVHEPRLVKKLSSMIGNQYEDSYLINLFNMIKTMESGRHKYLDGIILDRYSGNAMLAVNPLIDIAVNNGPWYDLTEIDQLRDIVNKNVQETETFIVNGSLISKKDVVTFTPIGMDYAHTLIELCDRLLEKKTDYIALHCEETFEPYLYLSTNYRYLVKASTFECESVVNASLRDWILSYAQCDYIPRQTMDTMWDLVKVGVQQ